MTASVCFIWSQSLVETGASVESQSRQLASRRHAGEEIRPSALAKTQRLADEELKAIHWTDDDLLRRRKGDPQKVSIAARLRRETTMTLEWIAARLRMGTATHVAALLQRLERKSQNSEKTDSAEEDPQDVTRCFMF
jgi:hypothetical protein